MLKMDKYKDLRILFLFVFSGAVGNMIDRIRLGYVIDMFDFRLINFPVFNVADIYVTCSMIILLILILFKYKDNELEDLFGRSKRALIKNKYMETYNIEADENWTDKRVDKALADYFDNYSRSFLKKLLDDGNILVNDKKQNQV